MGNIVQLQPLNGGWIKVNDEIGFLKPFKDLHEITPYPIVAKQNKVIALAAAGKFTLVLLFEFKKPQQVFYIGINCIGIQNKIT